MANYRLTLCYDGTRWKGWQKQGNTEQTIQGKLEALLTRLLDQPVEVAGSGRTDAGAHAKMQVASFRAKTDLETEEILAGLRRYLPADIGAISLEQVEPRFHARLSCTGKTYVYRIWNSELPNVFERHYLYHIQESLDVAAMRLAAEDLCGTHDFRAFCSLKKFKRSTVRRLEAITIQELGPELRLTFTGDGFLYHFNCRRRYGHCGVALPLFKRRGVPDPLRRGWPAGPHADGNPEGGPGHPGHHDAWDERL